MEHTSSADYQTIVDSFMNNFRLLERYLKMDSADFNYRTYTSALNASKNKVIQNAINRADLLVAGDLRNIIAHNNNVALPTKEFLEVFQTIVEHIINPLTAEKVMCPVSKMIKCQLDETIITAHQLMKKHRISNIPILLGKKLAGVFSEATTFAHLLNDQGELIIDLKKASFRDISWLIALEAHPSLRYQFVARDEDINALNQRFKDDYHDEKKTELLFVTQTGRPDESLLGLITVFDLLRD